jgi:hypothetical protein
MKILSILARLLIVFMVITHLFGMIWFAETVSSETVMATYTKVAVGSVFIILPFILNKTNLIIAISISVLALAAFGYALFIEYIGLEEYISKFGAPTGKILINSIFVAGMLVVLTTLKRAK